ncbi:polysaccharide export protein [Sphingomonas sanguinis]|uniref:Polysaccharide export protein n=1 Tax=Sphingomonas sanguinis TaxID=33051 RepID=A0ABU5LSU2_9SPHN|nr:polysaccharide biosynthesis/export family protein [Sphingomonas sanguinis]MDZ7283009.1 polysaccharide export protein [Sphingomonas sanguinis]
MMKARSLSLLLTISMLSSACSTVPTSRWNLPSGQQAYTVIPEQAAAHPPEYRINPQDKLTITVFREPDLSVQEAPVESGGGMVLPLIGRIQAAGQTTTELSNNIATQLRTRYLVNPTVSVIVASSRSQNVTVDGAVTEAGVYELQGNTTLLQSIAMAKGATRVAELDRVAVFRTIDGKRNGAIFDVNAIRAGDQPDLPLQNGDYVVVGASNIKALWYDVLGVLPAFALFVPLVR